MFYIGGPNVPLLVQLMSKVSSQKSLQTSLHKNLPCKGVKWEAGSLGLGAGLLTSSIGF